MKLYLRYLKIHMQSQMQYKVSFLLGVLAQFLSGFSAFLSIYLMFQRFHQVQDFTYEQVLLCFAIVLIAFSTAECFARGFDTFPTLLGNGEFDRMLLRPRSTVFQVLCGKMDFSRLGRFIQAAVVLIYAIPASGVVWTGEKIGLMILMVISGTVIFSGLFSVYASLAFFSTEGLEFMNIFTDGGREFGRYPFSIYGSAVLRFFTYVIPLALFQYYPFLCLIDRSDSLLYRLLPLVGILFLLPCYGLWRIGLRHYRSTGS